MLRGGKWCRFWAISKTTSSSLSSRIPKLANQTIIKLNLNNDTKNINTCIPSVWSSHCIKQI